MGKGMAEIGRQGEDAQVNLVPGMYGVTLAPGTYLYEEAHQLLVTQFARVQTGVHADSAPSPSYVDATTTAEDLTISMAVCQDRQDRQDIGQGRTKRPFFGTFRHSKVTAHPSLLLGTARVELAGATLIESMIRLKPSSSAARALEEGTVAEIGSFAAIDGLAKTSLLDAIDTIVATALRIAQDRGVERLWIFPRNGFMSLMRAEIPELLPPYHFSLCEDVAGWNEESAQLRQFREMRLRGLGRWPDIFQITRSAFERDLAERLALVAARRASREDIERLLPLAMLHAQRMIRTEAAAFHRAARGGRRPTLPPVVATPAVARENDTPSSTPQETAPGDASDDSSDSASPQPLGFLPFAGERYDEGQYLRDVVRRGGKAAADYKSLNRHFLQLSSGQRVLDVGCGSGVDLAVLSDAVGSAGRVVGIDHSPERVQEARDAIAAEKRSNVAVLLADVETLTFPTGEFDRVRADRVLQHVGRQRTAIAEMWRVLMPGGIMSVVEPDWATIALAPASAMAEDDDATLAQVLAWCRGHLRHPLIGRQLHGLLHEQGVAAWQSIAVEAKAYTFTDWNTVDAVLQLSSAAHALMREQPEVADDVREWLRMTEMASGDGTFFATIPLFFATARKAG